MPATPITKAYDAEERALARAWQDGPLAREARSYAECQVSELTIAARTWDATNDELRGVLRMLHQRVAQTAKRARVDGAPSLPRGTISGLAFPALEPPRRLDTWYVELERPGQGWREFQRVARRVLEQAGTPFRGVVLLVVGLEQLDQAWSVQLQATVADPRADAGAFRPLRAELATTRKALRLHERVLAGMTDSRDQLVGEVAGVVHAVADVVHAQGGSAPATASSPGANDAIAKGGRAAGHAMVALFRKWRSGQGDASPSTAGSSEVPESARQQQSSTGSTEPSAADRAGTAHAHDGPPARDANWVELRRWCGEADAEGRHVTVELVGLPGRYRLSVRGSGEPVHAAESVVSPDRARGLDVHVQEWVVRELTEWAIAEVQREPGGMGLVSGFPAEVRWDQESVAWLAPVAGVGSGAAGTVVVEWTSGQWTLQVVRERVQTTPPARLDGPATRPARPTGYVLRAVDELMAREGVVLA